MNNYLAREEKNNLVRLMILKVQLEKVLETYSALGNVDKAFLADLRHSKTRLHKATEIRVGYLDDDAKKNLLSAISKLHITFLPTPEAKKAHKEMLELQSMMPIAVEDFENWYEFIIETTCKPCTKLDYEECPARKVLLKYGIFPADPGAKDKCQYSYAAVVVEPAVPGQLIEKTEFAELGSVSFREHYAVKKQIEELQEKNAKYIEQIQELHGKVNLAEKRFDFQTEECLELFNENNLLVQQLEESKELQVKWDDLFDINKKLTNEVEKLTIEQIKENLGSAEEQEELLHPVVIGLISGGKLEFDLPEYFAKNLITEIKRSKLSRGICAQHIDGEFIAIDMQEVVTLQVVGLPGAEVIKPHTQAAQAVVQTQNISEPERYWIECKCGSEYFATMNAGRPIASCRDCQSRVFADRQAEKHIDYDRKSATIMTNRYFVSRDPQPSQENSLRDIKNTGRGYKDPCQLFNG